MFLQSLHKGLTIISIYPFAIVVESHLYYIILFLIAVIRLIIIIFSQEFNNTATTITIYTILEGDGVLWMLVYAVVLLHT